MELFLWLYGIPGCGKTILSSTIIEDVLYHYHDPTMAVIYFYFDFNDVEKQQYEKMLRSLITQLSLQCTSTPTVHLDSEIHARGGITLAARLPSATRCGRPSVLDVVSFMRGKAESHQLCLYY
jgi:hypothetical protein